MTPRAIVEAIYTTFNEGDIEAWKALVAEDLVWITGGRLLILVPSMVPMM